MKKVSKNFFVFHILLLLLIACEGELENGIYTPQSTSLAIIETPSPVVPTSPPTIDQPPLLPTSTILPTLTPVDQPLLLPTNTILPTLTPVPTHTPLPATPTNTPLMPFHEAGQIVFTYYDNNEGDIYLVNGDGTGLTQLTNNPAADFSPVWSPDGNKIAFISQRDGHGEVYVMNADGSSQQRLTYSEVGWGVHGTNRLPGRQMVAK